MASLVHAPPALPGALNVPAGPAPALAQPAAPAKVKAKRKCKRCPGLPEHNPNGKGCLHSKAALMAAEKAAATAGMPAVYQPPPMDGPAAEATDAHVPAEDSYIPEIDPVLLEESARESGIHLSDFMMSAPSPSSSGPLPQPHPSWARAASSPFDPPPQSASSLAASSSRTHIVPGAASPPTHPSQPGAAASSPVPTAGSSNDAGASDDVDEGSDSDSDVESVLEDAPEDHSDDEEEEARDGVTPLRSQPVVPPLRAVSVATEDREARLAQAQADKRREGSDVRKDPASGKDLVLGQDSDDEDLPASKKRKRNAKGEGIRVDRTRKTLEQTVAIPEDDAKRRRAAFLPKAQALIYQCLKLAKRAGAHVVFMAGLDCAAGPLVNPDPTKQLKAYRVMSSDQFIDTAQLETILQAFVEVVHPARSAWKTAHM